MKDSRMEAESHDNLSPVAPRQSRQPAPTAGDIIGSLFETTVEAFINAILIYVLGMVAVSIVGSVCEEMIPSLPPGLKPRPLAEAVPAGNVAAAWTFLTRNLLGFIFGIVFVLMAWSRLGRLFGWKRSEGSRWARKVSKRISEDWFGLVVSNAFGAFITTIIVTSVTHWSWRQWVVQAFIGWIVSGIQNLGSWLFGASAGERIGSWFNWFGENQIKFMFWFFYLAAVCDDLGVPNLKTLARLAMRRARRECKEKEGKESKETKERETVSSAKV